MRPTLLRKLRYGVGMTQKELAERLDIPVNTLARWERGKLNIRHPTILYLALKYLEAEKKGE